LGFECGHGSRLLPFCGILRCPAVSLPSQLLGLEGRGDTAGLFKALLVWLRSPVQSLHDQSRAPVPLGKPVTDRPARRQVHQHARLSRTRDRTTESASPNCAPFETTLPSRGANSMTAANPSRAH
jgi:hypothetical protein